MAPSLPELCRMNRPPLPRFAAPAEPFYVRARSIVPSAAALDDVAQPAHTSKQLSDASNVSSSVLHERFVLRVPFDIAAYERAKWHNG